MGSSGAPTGKWETVPGSAEPDAADMRKQEARLIVRRPGVPEVEVPIEKSEFVIGRLAAEVDLVLDDDLVSRKHARLTVDPRGYFKLEDLGSHNGIRFADRPVRRLNLVDGDVFKIGRTELVFHAKMVRLAKARVSEPPPPPAPAESSAEVPIPKPAPSPAGGTLEPPRPKDPAGD